MAEHFGFFDALETADGQFDRTYSARDYSENLATIISNGVLRSSNDDLKVNISGLSATVGAGRAWINGCWYKNDSDFIFSEVTAPTGGARYDRVILRYSNLLADRNIKLMYLQGEAASNPSKPVITRNDDVYDLVLADIYISANASTATVTDTRGDTDVCGWIYSVVGSDDFFKSLDNQLVEIKDKVATTTVELRYKQITTLTSQSNKVSITIPEYDENVNQNLTVLVNGIHSEEWTVNDGVISFANALVAGTTVTVIITVAKDGTGIQAAVTDVEELKARVTALESGGVESTYNYNCNGINDNALISQICQDFLSVTTDNQQMRLNIYGKIGIEAAASGDGSQLRPFKFFNFGKTETQPRKIIINFANADRIDVTAADGTYSTIFAGSDVFIENVNVNVTSGGYVNFFDGERISAKDCEFYGTATNDIICGKCCGTFTDCKVSITSTGGHAFCFHGNGNLLRINGGNYYCWTANDTKESVCFYVEAYQTENVLVLNSVNCPQYSRSGYYQTNTIKVNSGYASLTGCTVWKAPALYSTDNGMVFDNGTMVISKPVPSA
jgi:hypothetical protein